MRAVCHIMTSNRLRLQFAKVNDLLALNRTVPQKGNGQDERQQMNEHNEGEPGAFLNPITGLIVKFNSDIGRTYIAHYRASHPEATPQDVLDHIERQFWKLSAFSGGSVGAVASIPVVGTASAITLSVAEQAAFVEAAALYIMTRAGLHGLPADDLVRRHTLIFTVMLGPLGEKLLLTAVPRTSKHWAKAILTRTPASSLRALNSVLGRNMITKYGTKQGVIVLGRAIPFGIGAILGGTLGALSARAIMAGADTAFGSPPAFFPNDDGGADGDTMVRVPRTSPSTPTPIAARVPLSGAA